MFPSKTEYSSPSCASATSASWPFPGAATTATDDDDDAASTVADESVPVSTPSCSSISSQSSQRHSLDYYHHNHQPSTSTAISCIASYSTASATQNSEIVYGTQGHQQQQQQQLYCGSGFLPYSTGGCSGVVTTSASSYSPTPYAQYALQCYQRQQQQHCTQQQRNQQNFSVPYPQNTPNSSCQYYWQGLPSKWRYQMSPYSSKLYLCGLTSKPCTNFLCKGKN
ncbi:unnamed protein product [Gongylonema pulchrum]|uniref:Uncharacterized protein n=1 Tax=Gongylonema pulchrum TaxID=637853 RepID=A0A183EH14_9BILA|nr:unnamed protein product [Gongylonema pulchrum]